MKSSKGNLFNEEVETELRILKENGTIVSYQVEPVLSIPGYGYSQLNPDFSIKLWNRNTLYIDNTTTVRSDRLKQKQWEAYGVKQADISSMYYIIVPNPDKIGTPASRGKEWGFVLKERSKIHNDMYFSAIDKLLSLDELKGELYCLSSRNVN